MTGTSWGENKFFGKDESVWKNFLIVEFIVSTKVIEDATIVGCTLYKFV